MCVTNTGCYVTHKQRQHRTLLQAHSMTKMYYQRWDLHCNCHIWYKNILMLCAQHQCPYQWRLGGSCSSGDSCSRPVMSTPPCQPYQVSGQDIWGKHCRRSQVRIWVDNARSIGIWKEGYSTRCKLCTMIVLASGRVTAAIGCWVTVDKLARCSQNGVVLADELSKGRSLALCMKLPFSWAINMEPAWIPPSFLGG